MMDFRSPTVAAQQNAKAVRYLTRSLRNPEAGRHEVERLISELGNAVDLYPDWHPILTAPPRQTRQHVGSLAEVPTYKGAEHVVSFVRGFVCCPYREDVAPEIVERVRGVTGLEAYKLDHPLYAEGTHPVVVAATDVEVEADGTIRGRDALAWFLRLSALEASYANVAETWWNVRSLMLGSPHGSRSSLFVNQHTGVHMRKILEAMNASGVFGPIKESSLEMLSPRKRATVGETLIRTAVANWDGKANSFVFELRSEACKASLRDTWNDNHEISVRVEIGNFDLYVTGFYYPADGRVTHVDPRGKRELAEKFL